MTNATYLEWLSVTQAVERFPIGRTLIYQEIAKGVLPHIKLGGKILIRADALDTLLEASDDGKKKS